MNYGTYGSDLIMVQIPVGDVVAAAQALGLAGRWALAEDLLASSGPASPDERAALALTAAQVAVDGDFWQRTATAGPALERAAEALQAAAPDPLLAFDLAFLRLRQDYFAELLAPGGPRFGPDGRDPAAVDEFARRADRLRHEAPDERRGGEATFYAGLIEDNLRGDSAAARPLFAAAVAAGEATGDGLLTSEALRHLGYLDDQAGQPDLAREQWQRATALRQRAGCVPLTLAQQLLIAEMTASRDPAAARPAVAEIRRWAQALGLVMLTAQADALLTGAGG